MLMRNAKTRQKDERGFTLVELLVAMSVFSFMLVIIVVGFVNIVHLHNEAIASNIAQDNARTGMDELVRGVRASSGVVSTTPGPSGTVCLSSPQAGQNQIYYLNAGVLMRASNCATKTNPTAITSSSVVVSNFAVTVQSTGPKIVKPVVQITVTVGTAGNGTTVGAGASLACGNTNSDRTFCSVVTLTSAAVPR